MDSLPVEPQGKPKNTGVGSLSLLWWIFLTQELNWGLLHFRRILYQLSYKGSPITSLTLIKWPPCVYVLRSVTCWFLLKLTLGLFMWHALANWTIKTWLKQGFKKAFCQFLLPSPLILSFCSLRTCTGSFTGNETCETEPSHDPSWPSQGYPGPVIQGMTANSWLSQAEISRIIPLIREKLLMVVVFFLFFNFFSLSVLFFYFLTLQYCIGFAIYQHESATGTHVLPSGLHGLKYLPFNPLF